jgi:hypothetical protein
VANVLAIREAIFAGVKKANLTLGYDNCTTSPAVLCPCGDFGVHVATLAGERIWICKDKTRCSRQERRRNETKKSFAKKGRGQGGVTPQIP